MKRSQGVKLIAFQNFYMKGVSGGDIRFIEIAKRIDLNKVVFTSSLGKKLCKERGLHATYILTSKERYLRESLGHILLAYLRRITQSLLILIKLETSECILWSTSDYLPDVLPVFIYKLINRKVKWLASVYHLIPRPSKRPGGFIIPNLLSFIGQAISLPLIAKYADIVQSETVFVKDMLIERYKVFPNKILVCSGGINREIIDNLFNEEGIIYDACFLARLHKSKGIFDLVEAWRYVCNFKKDARLAIIGGGLTDMVNKLKCKIRQLGLEDNVYLLGLLSEEEKYRVLKRSRLYILPSYEEGIPITFYEAMYCGLPIITYYLPTYKEIKDYIIGVPLGNVRRLAEEIIRVLENETLAQKLGNRGRKFAKEHTWDRIANYIISQIEKLTGDNLTKCLGEGSE
ncbi:MAG: glycosyltransferase [Nitrososphaeria archaeon]